MHFHFFIGITKEKLRNGFVYNHCLSHSTQVFYVKRSNAINSVFQYIGSSRPATHHNFPEVPGGIQLFGNFRPIPLLSSVSQVFEKAADGQIYEYFSSHALFSTVSTDFENITQPNLLRLN